MRSLIMLIPLMLFSQEINIEQLFNVKTTKVIEKTVSEKRSYYGFLKLDEKKIYDIAPRFGGYIEKLYAKEIYQKVKKEENLAKVYSPEVYRAKEEYASSLIYKRDKKMIEATFEKLKLLDIDKNEIETIKKTKKSSAYTFIKSPIDGFIIKKSVNNKSSFNKKEKIFQIADMSTLQFLAKIPQKEISFVKKAQYFNIYIDILNRYYYGKNLHIYPIISKNDSFITLKIDIKNDGELIAGMYAKLEVGLKDKKFLLIPKSAVIRKDGKWYAFKVGEFEGEYEPVEIEVKPLNNKFYKLISGLQKGDEIADSAMFLLDSDAQINGLF